MRELQFWVEVLGIKMSLTVWESSFCIAGRSYGAGAPSRLKSLHRHNGFELFLMPNSTICVHTLDGTRTFFDSTVIIPPTLEHYVTTEAASVGYYLYFVPTQASGGNGSRMDELMSRIGKDVISLSIGQDEQFYAQKINSALQGGEHLQMLPHLLSLLMFEVCSRLLSPVDDKFSVLSKSGKHLNTIELYIASHYTESIRLPDLARELYLCPKQVSRIIKKHYGCTLSEMVNRHRLSVACMLLRHTELEISDISEQVGYAYENRFYTLFKKAYGVTPKQYREEFSQ